jgi:hypothetical protein
MAEKVKVPVGEVNSTKRAKAYLVRLGGAGGRRLLVDLDPEASEALDRLVAAGYGSTNKTVVSRALVAASEHIGTG